MEVLIDPEGRRVVWSSQQWEHHVVRNRTFLAGCEWMGMRTVEMADFITKDEHFPNRLCYYLQGIDPDAPREDYFKVVIDFADDPSEGRLITGFLTTRVNQREANLWQRH